MAYTLTGARYVSFASGLTVGIFDPFILLSNQTLQVTLMMIGFFIIIADAPFIDSRTYYVLIRSGGSLWRHSMAGYIALQVLVYEGIILLGGMLPCIFRGNLAPVSDWGEAMQILLGAAPKIAWEQYDLPILSSRILHGFSAVSAFGHSILLNGAYLFLLGIVIFTGNLNTRLPVGNMAAVGIHLVGLLAISDFVPLPQASLICHGMMQCHIPGQGPLSLWVSYLLFGGLDVCVLLVLKKISRHTDYNTAVSQKTW